MSDESKITKEDILEQMQAGHRARLDGSILQNLGNKDAVQFREVMPNRPQQQPQTAQAPQQQGICLLYTSSQLLYYFVGVCTVSVVQKEQSKTGNCFYLSGRIRCRERSH